MKNEERYRFPVCLKGGYQLLILLFAILTISPVWGQDIGFYIKKLDTVCQTAGNSGEVGLKVLEATIALPNLYLAGLEANEQTLIRVRDEAESRMTALENKGDKEAYRNAAIEYRKARRAVDKNISQQMKLKFAIGLAQDCIAAQRKKIEAAQSRPPPSPPAQPPQKPSDQPKPPSPPPPHQSEQPIPPDVPEARPHLLSRFGVSCHPPEIEEGKTSTCTATGEYADRPDQYVNLTGATWRGATGGIFTGPILAKGVERKTFTISAEFEGAGDTATVTVLKPYDVGTDLGRGAKGPPVDPNIGDPFQQQQPGGKPQDTTGTVSSAPPVLIPGGEPPQGGEDKGTTATSSVPTPGQPGVGFPCYDPNGNLYYSPTPCPQQGPSLVPGFTKPQGGKPEKDPGRTQKDPVNNAAKIECEKKGKIYHWHADTQKFWCCDTRNHGKQGQKSGGH